MRDEVVIVGFSGNAVEIFETVSSQFHVRAILDDNPALVNESAEGDGWFYRMKLSNMSDLDGLMDAEAYAAYLEALD